MGKLEQTLTKDLKESMKSKNTLAISTLRMLIASVKNLAIEKKIKEVKDEDVLKIIAKQVKQHLDSIESFKKGGRDDLVEKETKELGVLKSYLPEQLSEDKIEEIVKKAIASSGATSKSEFGKVMKLCMEEIKGRADGKAISSIVQKLLG